jgi:hypothetical protein
MTRFRAVCPRFSLGDPDMAKEVGRITWNVGIVHPELDDDGRAKLLRQILPQHLIRSWDAGRCGGGGAVRGRPDYLILEPCLSAVAHHSALAAHQPSAENVVHSVVPRHSGRCSEALLRSACILSARGPTAFTASEGDWSDQWQRDNTAAPGGGFDGADTACEPRHGELSGGHQSGVQTALH